MKFKTPYSKPVFTEKRLRNTLEFMCWIKPPVLVTGKRTEFEPHLEDYFGEKFRYTAFDLNDEWDDMEATSFNTILCFQVIEHLLNPLLFLQMCKRYLDEDGLLYISYPLHNFKAFWTSGHFHEYDKSRFHYLVKESGFKIVDYKERIMWRRIKGIRPIVRNTPLGWCKHQYYCLKKLDGKDVM